MSDTPTTGETGNQPDTPTNGNNTGTPAPAPTPPQVKTEDSDAEKFKRELQEQMRANQVLNEKLKAKEDAEAEAKRKQLEEQDEWKAIAEQEKAKREALESEKQEAETKETLRIAEESITAQFSPEAIEVAKEAGLSLTEDSDEAKETFKTKLQKISDRVVTASTVTPNNPAAPTTEPSNRAELIQRMRAGDKGAQTKVISELKSLDFMRQQAGYNPNQ